MIKSIISFYRRHQEKINFTFGFTGMLGIIFSIYTYIHPLSQKPILTFHISQVFDAVALNKSLDGLNIYFKGKDLQKEKQTLTVYKIRLINEGKGDLPLNLYGENQFGLSLTKGTGIFIGVNIIGDNASGTLQKGLNPNIKDSSIVFFKSLMFDSKKYADLELVVIHKVNVQPCFETIGEISGQGKILIAQDGEPPFFSVTDLQAIVMIIFLLCSMFFLGYIFFKTFLSIRKEIRKRIIFGYYNRRLKRITDEQLTLVHIYCQIGMKKFTHTMRILLDAEQTNKKFKEETIEENVVLRTNELRKTKKVDLGVDIKYHSSFLTTIKILIDQDFANELNGAIVIKPSILTEIESTLKFF